MESSPVAPTTTMHALGDAAAAVRAGGIAFDDGPVSDVVFGAGKYVDDDAAAFDDGPGP